MASSSDINSESKGLRDLWYSPIGMKIRKIIGRILYRLYRLGGELTAIVLGLGIVISFFLASTFSRQSTDVTFLRPNLQIWFAETFNGKAADFERLDIAWNPARDTFVVTAEKIVITDDDGIPLETFEYLQATLERDPENFYRPNLIKAEVQGGELSYVEDELGHVTIGLGPPENVGRIGPVYRSSSSDGYAASVDIGQLDTIILKDAKLNYVNAVSAMDLTAQLNALQTTLSSEGKVVFTAEGQLEQQYGWADFSVSGLSDTSFTDIKKKFEFRGLRPDQIAPQKGRFYEFRGIEAPVDLSGEIDFSQIEGLRSSSINVNVGAGTLRVLRGDKNPSIEIESFKIEANLEPGNERMKIGQMDLQSDQLSFNATGFLTQLGNLNDGDVNSSPVFDLSIRNIKNKANEAWDKDININRLDMKGQADFDARTLKIRQGRIAMFDTVFDFDSFVQLNQENQLLNIELNADSSGNLAPSQILSIWPDDLVGGARRWVERSIIGGRLTDVELDVDLDEAFFELRSITPENLKLTFHVEEGDVQYMATMPPAIGLEIDVVMQGNRMTADYIGGQVESLLIDSGRVEIPVIFPKGGDIIITGRGRGDARAMLAVLDNDPFRFATRYNIDPADIGGIGEVEALVRRPLLEFFPREEIDYEMKGRFTQVKAPFSIGQFDIFDGNVDLDVTRDRMILSGPINIGPWRPFMRWQETFGDNPPPTQYTVSGLVTSDVLDSLGIASRGWFSGQADVNIDATGRGMNVKQAKVNADLTNAALSIERIWMKPEGESAQVNGVLFRDVETGYDIRDAVLTGEGLSLLGELSLEPDFKLKSLKLDEVKIKDFVDGKLKLGRENDRLTLDLEGEFLDISPWTEEAFQTRESGFDIPMTLNANLEQLVLDPVYDLSQSRFSFEHTGDIMESVRLFGQRPDGELLVELATLENGNRKAKMVVPDASQAIAAFLGLTNTTGGYLKIEAELPPAGEEGAYIGEARMQDFRLIEAPALAQLLSLASLTGLADTLSGGSMKFDRFVLPFTIQGDDISVRDARLYGPALGMTGDGDIDLDLRVMDFDGTIVPSYTANSILGDIPILGDLFVQEKDGGLFALTYTVSGPFEKTQIAVNPLSALTPGFLRQIFKPERDKVPDDVRAKIEDVAPPILEE